MSTKLCASIKIQTIIHKYAKFLMYIASKRVYNQNSISCKYICKEKYINKNVINGL